MSTYPVTDSILKRHHQQLTGEISGGMIGDYPITDSILRRHDAQHILSGGSSNSHVTAANAALEATAATAANDAGTAAEMATSAIEDTVSKAADATAQPSSPAGKIILFIAALIAGYFLLKFLGGR